MARKQPPRPTLPYEGISAYGMYNKTFRKVLSRYLEDSSLSKRPATAVVLGSFGSDEYSARKFFSKMASLSRPHCFMAHLDNGVARRRRTQSKYDIAPNMDINAFNRALAEGDSDVMKAIRKRVRNFKTFCESYADPKCRLYLSLTLEDNFDQAAHLAIRRVVRDEWPYAIVSNPMRSMFSHDEHFVREYHAPLGAIRGNSAINGDGDPIHVGGANGTNPSPSHLQKALRLFERGREANCHYAFLWLYGLQGLKFKPNGEPDYTVRPYGRTIVYSDAESKLARLTLEKL